ncbi:hypothetical protein V5F77_01440 [Xanthobacter sp. DSM 24535]|uniref:hypothetical protein n=1 Tax=Roseixanthobacter psychrophilus TaxID=3119917 RepID=UPI00372A6D43
MDGTPAAAHVQGHARLVLAAIGLGIAVLFAGAGLLWFVHGPATFLDMLAGGFATCF